MASIAPIAGDATQAAGPGGASQSAASDATVDQLKTAVATDVFYILLQLVLNEAGQA